MHTLKVILIGLALLGLCLLAGDDSDAINRAISATINGISAGLRNIG